MVTAAWSALTIVLFLAAVGVHQAGHAAAYRELGIPLRRAGFGLPARPYLTLQPTSARPYPLTVSPWIIGAYAEPDIDPEAAAQMTYRQAAWYCSGGVIANLTMGFALLAVYFFLRGELLPMLVTAALAGAAWGARHWVAVFLVPVAGLAVLGTEIWGLTAGLTSHTGITLLQLLTIRSVSAALLAAAVFSLSVALFHLLPIPALDGGRMVAATARTWPGPAGALYARASSWILAAVIAAAILSDVLRLLGT